MLEVWKKSFRAIVEENIVHECRSVESQGLRLELASFKETAWRMIISMPAKFII